jgi:hypothetical protein
MGDRNTSVTAPMSSPVKVTRGKFKSNQRTHPLFGADASGALAIYGDSLSNYPDRFVCVTRSGSWRIPAPIEQNRAGYFTLVDPSGREVARIEHARRQKDVLRLPSGETAEVSSTAGMIRGFSCDVGSFAHATAPRIGPQRGTTVSFADGVLNRPDAEVIFVASVWMAEREISNRISDYAAE